MPHLSQFDPGCVKTCTSQECAELFSLSSSLSGGRKHFWFSNLRNRDGISTRRLNVGVFTRPRPTAEKGDLDLLVLWPSSAGVDDVFCPRSSHTEALPLRGRQIGVLDSVPQQH